jgi:hypothetical protein
VLVSQPKEIASVRFESRPAGARQRLLSLVMSGSRRATLLLVLFGAAFSCAVIAFIADGACVDIPPLTDSTATVTNETKALRSFPTQEAHLARDTNVPNFSLAVPKAVRVVGRTAILTMEQPVDEGNYIYLQIWQRIFRRYHPWRGRCVSVEFRWPTGSFTQHWNFSTL